ncbi:hypothetical protein EJB05_32808 [Eragrostis curvula]|uniref:Uncharacterized protein n=1 Tax=Eragrostis curvula TaxID=38414 RepID=A0A5J9UH55_9POAL|nr:hypothetical protein EJB05_32808 [Eragrostis curvula]
MAAAAARSLLRSSGSLLRAAPARSASSSATRPSLRRALAAPPRLLRSPFESSFCVESLLPLHSATAAARMKSMLAVPGRGLGWLTEGEFRLHSCLPSSMIQRLQYMSIFPKPTMPSIGLCCSCVDIDPMCIATLLINQYPTVTTSSSLDAMLNSLWSPYFICEMYAIPC